MSSLPDRSGARRKGPTGTMPGELNGRARLTTKQVKTIRETKYTRGLWARLGRKWKVHPETVRKARYGQSWGHLP